METDCKMEFDTTQRNKLVRENSGQSNSLRIGIPKLSMGSYICTMQYDVSSLSPCTEKRAVSTPNSTYMENYNVYGMYMYM